MGRVAVGGLIANLIVAYFLHGAIISISKRFFHVIGDTLSSIAVILAAVWITFTGS
jgi:cobalt-zinc-cadmium efflux system protein